MTWVLTGIPTVEYEKINAHVEKITRVPTAMFETTFQSEQPDQAQEEPGDAD